MATTTQAFHVGSTTFRIVCMVTNVTVHTSRSLRQGNVFTLVCVILFTGGLCMMSLPVWLPGPMFFRGVLVQGGSLTEKQHK